MRWKWVLVTGLVVMGTLFGKETKKNFFPITQDFVKGKQIAQAYNKPIVLIFSGSDWCIYSQKLFQKIFNALEFYQEVKKEFIFVKVDFPELDPSLSKEKVEEKFNLKEFFHVKDFPTVVLLDQQLEEICRMGFSEEIPAEYGKRLISIWKKHEEIKQELSRARSMSFSQLYQRYQEAKELGSFGLLKKVIDLGMKVDKDNFFHYEAYQRSSRVEKASLREKILASQLDNRELIKLKLDIFDYQSLSLDKKKEAVISMVESLKMLKEQGYTVSSLDPRLEEWLSQEFKQQVLQDDLVCFPEGSC